MIDASTFQRAAFLADPDNFLIDLPLEKAGESDTEHRIVQGVASCEVKDEDGEQLIQKGIDYRPLIEKGSINWDHKDSQGPEFIIGWPLDIRLVKANDFQKKLGKSVDGLALWVKGELFNNPELKPKADDTWKHILATEGTPRQLGWSIQGRTIERDRVNKSRITKSVLYHLAITHQPINQLTFAEMAKSFAGVMTTQSAAPLLLENLSGKLTSVLWGECKKDCYTNRGQFKKGKRGALEHLHECHGEPIPESVHFLKTLAQRGVKF